MIASQFKKRPWLWVFVAFFILIGAWTTLISIALTHQPEKVKIEER
ncbi:MAG: hypothetical protein ACI9R3_004720 [Verrucomicrobiales bacterium]|jgi:hypothetical protein